MVSVESTLLELNSPAAALPSATPAENRSWVFRLVDIAGQSVSVLFGIASLIFLLAVVANIPILQVLSFGYLLEVTGRLARKQPLRDSFVGLRKAARMGGIILGAWLLLWPARFLSQVWLEAYIIDPTSNQTLCLRVAQFAVIALVVAHLFCAAVCGGRLRYFFWPIVAPFSFAIWFVRRFAGVPWFRRILRFTIGWISPRLVDDVCNAAPIGEWFLPSIVWKRFRAGRLFTDARDDLWAFVNGLRPGYYFWFGLKGFIGSLLWLLVPTLLLINATSASGPATVIGGLLGGFIAVPVFSLLPFLQAHFAVDGRLSRFTEVRAVLKNVGRAPIAHLFALLLTLALALPLFLLKVERIPDDLLWTLSIVFIVFTWPAKWITGWAYRRGAFGQKPRKWWIRIPTWGLLLLVSFAFVFLMFFTRYITWNGANSLLENHVFLLPAPFWLGS